MILFSRIAFRNVIKNWRHSLAAIISMSAGFLSLVIFQGYIQDVEDLYVIAFRNRSMYGDLLIENPVLQKGDGRSEPEKYYLTLADQEKITTFFKDHEQQIMAKVRFLPAVGTITNGKSSAIFLALGVDVQEGAKMRGPLWSWDTPYGKPLYLENAPGNILLGEGLASLLDCNPDPVHNDLFQNGNYEKVVRPFKCQRSHLQLTAVTETGQSNALDVQPVGLIDAGYADIDVRWVSASIEDLQSLLNTKKVRYISVLLKEKVDVGRFQADLNDYLSKANIPAHAHTWLEHEVAQFFLQTMSLLNIFKVFIVVVIMTISGLSVFNTLVKIVKERTKEIGTLRSLGFHGTQVQKIFLFESVYLCILGSLIGAFFALLVSAFLNQAHIAYRAGMLSEPVLFQIAVNPLTYGESLLLLSVLSLVTSWIATRHIVRTRISENLTFA